MNFKGIDDILNYATKKKWLTSLTLELLTSCNWNCIHCYITDNKNKGLSTDLLIDIFKQARKIGVIDLTFTGGEIFLRKDIMILIRKAKEMGFNINLYSNISLLNDKLIKELSQLYISSIYCTIFSLEEKIHDSITKVKGSLKKCLNILKDLKKYKIPVIIQTPLMNINYNSFRELVKFCKRNEFQYKVDKEIIPKLNGDKTPLKYKLKYSQLLEIVEETDLINNYEVKEHKKDDLMCIPICHSLYIDSNGIVYPCNRFLIKIGDIKKESLEYIWSNSEILHKYQNLKWSDATDCINCKINKFCVRCPGLALLENGNENSKVSSACIITKARYEIREKF